MEKIILKFAVASCAPDGGIYKYALYEGGNIEALGKIPMSMPMYFRIKGNVITALLRAPFDGSDSSGIAEYDLETGERISPIISTLGAVGCHIAVDGDDAYCANYISGSVFKAPDLLVTHKGQGVNTARQESPHAHGVFLSPDKKYVLACDLGTDEIYVYDRRLKEISRVKVPDGSGARHLCFSKDGKFVYCINEMSATLSVFSYSDGALAYIKDADIKPKGFSGQGKGAAIKISGDGKRLYMTERGSKTIVLAELDGENVTVVGHYPCGGDEPRDIALACGEKILICANQFSNNVTLHSVSDDGAPAPLGSFELCAPLCICEL